MLDLQLREEFRQSRIKGTTIDFDPQAESGVLKASAADFLKITYPSHDLLKLIEAIQPQKSHPVVVWGERGRGKSHLLATIYHLCNDPEAGKHWLTAWAGQLGDPRMSELILCTGRHIIGESLHHQRYKYLWELLFTLHPEGQRIKGKWEHEMEKMPGDKSPFGVPKKDLIRELFAVKPTILILDEFQTWFDGLTDTRQYPSQKWAFNFIQILSEIAKDEPHLLTLVVSIRDNQSEAFQQLQRIAPILVDFKGDSAKADRRRLLLHRLFENRRQLTDESILKTIAVHVDEYLRLFQITQANHESERNRFLETWPFSPLLLNLLDDQVLVATHAQETRDLIRILVDLFKNAQHQPVITVADFSLTDEKSGVASLLDSLTNPTHRTLREIAIRNLEAVKGTSPQWKTELPHCETLMSSLWLRSLTMNDSAGALPHELQLDITRSEPVDDNKFSGELETIKENSFNIHEIAGRLVFRSSENPQAKLLAYAKNDKYFEEEEDIDELAKQIRYVLNENTSHKYRLLVMKPQWRTSPWEGQQKEELPEYWDSRLTTIVIPEFPEEFDKTMGQWLKQHMPQNRNTARFLFPVQEANRFYDDQSLMILVRSAYLAKKWSDEKTEDRHEYDKIKSKLVKELREKIKDMFNRYAVLEVWNYEEPVKCQFRREAHQARGEKILDAINNHVHANLFIPEDFEEFVLLLAQNGRSVAELLSELKEPQLGEKRCIPWIGDTDIREKLIDLAAMGKIAINSQGTLYQASPGEERELARQRMKGKIFAAGSLKETTLHLPDPHAVSGGAAPIPPSVGTGGVPPLTTPPGDVNNPFGNNPPSPPSLPTTPQSGQPSSPVFARKIAEPTSGLNLLGVLEKWGVSKSTQISEVAIKTDQMTGMQLQELLKKLPDGIKFALELDKEVNE